MKVIQPRVFNPRKTLFVGSVILVLIVVALTRTPPGPAHIHWMGRTMGTHYDIKIAHSPLNQLEARQLYQVVERYLQQMNDEMSTYIADSEISRFNRHEDTTPFEVSPSFAAVTRAALHWADRTGGALDPTLDPLINVWGFGHREEYSTVLPTEEAIEAARARSGYSKVHVEGDAALVKSPGNIELNLNAIAKGYAVDGIAELIETMGATNFYVEIGGDLVVSGRNREGQPWRIGIEMPDPESAPGESLHGIAHLSSGALAGSGDYRSFRPDENGEMLAHILDPRTGRPTRHALASVNVWAATCMAADAIATALIVMGPDEGPAWIESEPDAEAIFFVRQSDGTFATRLSSGFADRVGYAPLQTP